MSGEGFLLLNSGTTFDESSGFDDGSGSSGEVEVRAVLTETLEETVPWQNPAWLPYVVGLAIAVCCSFAVIDLIVRYYGCERKRRKEMKDSQQHGEEDNAIEVKTTLLRHTIGQDIEKGQLQTSPLIRPKMEAPAKANRNNKPILSLIIE